MKWDSSIRGAIWGMEEITSLSNISYLMSIVAAFPTICNFCDDWLGHYTFSAVSRSGKNTYLHAKDFGVLYNFFLITFMGIMIYEFAEFLWINPNQETTVFNNQLYYDILQISSVLLLWCVSYYIQQLLRFKVWWDL